MIEIRWFDKTMMEVLRSEGATPSERYLEHLCDRSFLTLWSYPNLFWTSDWRQLFLPLGVNYSYSWPPGFIVVSVG